jgi:dTDP-4-dehydrorhamnose 3,5-epimerase
MVFTETPLRGAYVIDIEPFTDERGYFARIFCRDEFIRHGLQADFPQHNISHNIKKGTIRGMHYQLPPHGEVKVVRCVKGTIFDVIIDIRQDSETYLKWFAVELSEDNGRALYIPQGFAHGFQTLTDGTLIYYLMGSPYQKGFDAGLRWDDKRVGIEWPITDEIIISDRDRSIKTIDKGQI